MKISKQRVLSILEEITDYAVMHTCLHEETHRGGVLWEICSECGARWADDEGGKPDDAHDLPKELKDAYDLIEEIKKD